MQIHLVRHGETIANKEKKMQGVTDTPLTTSGIIQAKKLASNLEQYNFDLCISSPLQRAKNTAKIIANQNLSILVDQNLIELDFGYWEGKTKKEISALHPAQYSAFWNSPLEYMPPKGESFQEVNSRIEIFLDKLKKEHTSKTILIVSHAIIIKTILIQLENRCLSTMWDEPFVHNCFHTIRSIEN